MSRVMKPIQHYRDRKTVEQLINLIADNCNSKHKLMLAFALYKSFRPVERATFNALKDQAVDEE